MAEIKEKTRKILVTSIFACLVAFGVGALIPVPFSFQSRFFSHSALGQITPLALYIAGKWNIILVRSPVKFPVEILRMDYSSLSS